MKFLMSFVVSISVYGSVLGQSKPELIPPSPAVYALAKYGEVPVSYYTGVPNVSIPIFALKDHDVQVGINLSYHASGVKVDEIASFVGLGWSLDAGGVITRVVRGRADGLDADGHLKPRRTNITYHSIYDPPQSAEDFISANDLYLAANNGTDNEPDEFFFNFMGKSGKFFFDQTGKAILENAQPLLVQWFYVDNDSQKFVIIDELGVKYEFSDNEWTFYPGYGESRASAWYLSKITTPTSNVISFEYYNGSPATNLIRGYTSTVVDITPSNADITSPLNYASFGSDGGVNELRLHKINTQNGSVEFQYKGEARLDYFHNIGWGALEKIIVYRPDNQVLQQTKISTSYFEANNAQKYDGGSPENYQCLNYRLRLDAVQSFDVGGISLAPPYKLEYLGDNDPTTNDIYSLPYRLSPKQDHFGYYNGSFNTHMFPGNPIGKTIVEEPVLKLIQQDHYDDGTHRVIGNGANREVNIEAVKACMLSKLTYPSGGFTTFEFESNGTMAPGARIKKVVSNPVAGSSMEKNYSYGSNPWPDPFNSYFKFYPLTYSTSTTCAPGIDGEGSGTGFPRIGPEFCSLLGIPYTPSGFALNPGKLYVKISATPQAILGSSQNFGYSSVTVSETNHGTTSYIFTNQSSYPDYQFYEGLEPYEITKLDNLFNCGFASTATDCFYSLDKFEARIGVDDWPNLPAYSNSWKRGVLMDKYISTEDNKLVAEEHYQYKSVFGTPVPAFKVIAIGNTPRYFYDKYYLPSAWNPLETTTKKTYDLNGVNPITTTTKFSYDNPDHFQVTKEETTLSDTRKEVILITYPLDYLDEGVTAIGRLKAMHIVAVPVEKVSYIDDGNTKTFVSGQLSVFKANGSGLKDQDLRLETAYPITNSTFKMSNKLMGAPLATENHIFQPDNRYSPVIKYESYDLKGNIVQYSAITDPKNAVIYDYNENYPISIVINASADKIAYTSFEADGNGHWSGINSLNVHVDPNSFSGKKDYDLTGTTLQKSIDPSFSFIVSFWGKNSSALVNGAGATARGSVTINNDHWTYFEKIISGVSNVTLSGNGIIDELRLYPSNAQMKTFCYEPMLGISTQVDINNRATYYSYDDFSRLKLVRDQDYNIISRYCYNYAGQPESCICSSSGPVWQNTITPPRCEIVNNLYTGNQEQEQIDRNSCSVSYKQLKWFSTGPNPAACAPNTCVNCTGANRKCINSICEQGIYICLDSFLDQNTGMYRNAFHYEFSDGSSSDVQYLYESYPCN